MKIAPSMLASDFSQMGNEIIKIAKAGADLVHIDVMDGHFVPNISFGSCVMKALRPLTDLPFDVHLMISHPLKYINEFAICGADTITFHIESKSDPIKAIKKIRLLNKNVGISLKPNTDITRILPFLPLVDVVLVMTVEPGKGGQIARSAGNSAQILGREGKYTLIRLSSGEVRKVLNTCRATVGEVGNEDHELVSLGKAGRKRHMGIRPTVRGSVMNPNDHPHGGGEGRAPIGRKAPVTPWGKPALGLKTRGTKKASDKLIVRRRKK